MSEEVLSQGEIDALLSAFSNESSNEADAAQTPTIKPYDFKRALRFSKDQIRSLMRVHENFARILTTFFAAQLRTSAQVTVLSVNQAPYDEFIQSLPRRTILNVFELLPLEGRVLMEVNPSVAYAILDRLLGGRGIGMNKVENLTEIEAKIMSGMFQRAFENYREAWRNITEITPVSTELEVNPQFLQMVSPNETVIVVALNVVIGETTGVINICIPHIVLEPIIPKLSVHHWMQNTNQKKRDPSETAYLDTRIEAAELPISAELGKAVITIEEFLLLAQGDVIELNTPVETPLTIKIGTVPKFTAQPGKMNRKLAVQIIDVLQGGIEENE